MLSQARPPWHHAMSESRKKQSSCAVWRKPQLLPPPSLHQDPSCSTPAPPCRLRSLAPYFSPELTLPYELGDRRVRENPCLVLRQRRNNRTDATYGDDKSDLREHLSLHVDLEVLPQAKRDRYIDAILRTVRK